MKKTISSLTALLLISSALGFTVNAEELDNSVISAFEINQGLVMNKVEDFISDAYSDFYVLSNFDSEVYEVSYDGNTAEFTVKTNFDKVLRAADVKELPFVQGMTASVKKMERSRSSDASVANYVLEKQVAEVEEYIGVIQNENAVFRVTTNIYDSDLSEAKLEVFGIDEFIPAKYFIPDSSEEMYNAGLYDLGEVVVNTKEAFALTYPDLDLNNIADVQLDKLETAKASIKYDRIAARDYANKYTSECGNSYNMKYWNPNYVGHTESGGVDCANYVSQAIYAGGIPTDSKWKPESIAWVNTGRYNSGGLTNYMTSKGYFNRVTRDTCAAGGFISHTDFSHVVFVVANDTVTRLFSSHTADRLKASFSSNYYKDFDYYYISPTYK